MTTFYHTHERIDVSAEDYIQNLSPEFDLIYKKFKGILKSIFFFHFSFIALFGCELTFLFMTFSKSTTTALALGLTVLSAFTYVLFYFYFTAKKEEEIEHLETTFFSQISESLPPYMEETRNVFYQTKATYAFLPILFDREHFGFSIPPFKFYQGHIFFLFHFVFGKSILLLQESLLTSLIKIHVNQLIYNALSIDLHTSLAGIYINMTKMYTSYLLRRKSTYLPMSSHAQSQIIAQKEKCLKLAVEELIIVDDLSPNNSWVHLQLAFCYHQLGLPQQEIREYEILWSLTPDNCDILFNLGKLYFEIGKNAKGLEIYSKLLKKDSEKAKSLLSFYHHKKIHN